MLIGIHKTVAELQEIIEGQITANKMALKEVEREYTDLQMDMRANPPRRATENNPVEDNRPARNLELQKKITELQNQNEWLAGKLDEAEVAIEKDMKLADKKVYLTLNDCIMLGIELGDESQEADAE
ncbi:hypothetical protein SAMN02799624_05402 [Paenibacillus sp. UNC496MF]|uniref:hypothetical protein n=1 Tax=Paenibacillus sp. UNC496MF TaxID=1502753 RepID=UPI0008F44609|nr:hypothetical protein [Paenibacillus sp. UNC496MF]SFJ65516.1 hypothetical protein SAMN02799624_05402 [Paenibacillus sp. UNC496MF]